MYNIIKSVIESGRYELTDMLAKIDTIWLQGDLTEEQRAELIALAREKALPENSYASIQAQIDTLFKKVSELEETVKSLNGDNNPEDTEEYPEYVQPMGAHDAYHNGDKCSENGKNYICIAPEGVAVVWPPSVMPGYWQSVDVPLTI